MLVTKRKHCSSMGLLGNLQNTCDRHTVMASETPSTKGPSVVKAPVVRIHESSYKGDYGTICMHEYMYIWFTLIYSNWFTACVQVNIHGTHDIFITGFHSTVPHNHQLEKKMNKIEVGDLSHHLLKSRFVKDPGKTHRNSIVFAQTMQSVHACKSAWSKM